MEHSGHSVDFRAERGMQSRVILHHRRGGPGFLRLDPDRSQHFRPCSDVRPNRFSGEEATRELRGARQGLAHLATEIQVPMVDA